MSHPRRTTYDFSPTTAADYEAARVAGHIAYLRASYHLGRPGTEDTVAAYRSGALKLGPATADEMERDRHWARENSRAHWAAMKDAVRERRQMESRARVERFVGGETAAWRTLSTLVEETNGEVLTHAQRSRNARKMAAYLGGRIAALQSVAAAAE